MTSHNLPHQSTTFVGRSGELTRIAALLADPACRLLTLCGAGGIGKTRLALQAAEQLPNFAQGVYFVSLIPVTSPDDIAAAIAAAISGSFPGSEITQPQLMRYLHEKHILLVLDNFEHLLGGVALLTDILSETLAVKLLVTSRERLNLREEWAFPLEGLGVPVNNVAEPLADFSAVQLFVQRARQVQPNFSLDGNARAVATICRVVEGMPLALELAAAWLRAMSPDQIAAHLTHGFDLLTAPHRNMPERHRSLRAVFQQSWNMLSPDEQQVMARLSVFRGGFDAEAAQHVAHASLSVLAALVDKSFVRLNANGRYDLHELLRQFAVESLSLEDTTATMQRHFDYFLMLAEQSEVHQFGRDQVEWFDRMEVELDNLRQALNWSLQNDSPESGVRLVTALGWFLIERVHWNESLSWFDRLFAANPNLPPSLHAKALYTAGACAGMIWDTPRAAALLQQALALARQNGDRRNIAWSLTHFALFTFKDHVPASLMLDESITMFRELDDPMGLSHALVRRGFRASDLKQYPAARVFYEEAIQIAQKHGDRVILGWCYICLAELACLHDHDLNQAKAYYELSLSMFRQARFYNVVNGITISLSHIERHLGNYPQAVAKFEEAFHQIDQNLTADVHPSRFNEVNALLASMADIAARFGQLRHAVVILGALERYGPPKLADTYSVVIGVSNDLDALRAQLGDAAFEDAWAAGEAMSRDELIAYVRSAAPILTETSQNPPIIQPLIDPLTPRELSILQLIADGHSNRAIAEKLVLSPVTVKWYVSEIFSKLSVTNRVQAVTQAQKLNLLTPEKP